MKAKVYIEHCGKKYILTKGWRCDSKRVCSLFQHGICDVDDGSLEIPCSAIGEAFYDITGKYHNGGFKEVK